MTEIERIKEQNKRRKRLHNSGTAIDSMKFVEEIYELKDVNRTVTEDFDFLITTIESQKKEVERLNRLVSEGNFPIYRKEISK